MKKLKLSLPLKDVKGKRLLNRPNFQKEASFVEVCREDRKLFQRSSQHCPVELLAMMETFPGIWAASAAALLTLRATSQAWLPNGSFQCS